ncbi:Hexosyltransferase [Sarracenia purpurea var. burkii]
MSLKTMQGSNGGHVAVLAFPFGTHAAPLLTLVCRLASGAPNLRFSFLNTGKSNREIFSGIKADVYPNVKAFNVEDGIPEDHVFSGHPLEAVQLFLKAMPGNFEAGLKEAEAKTGMQITCLLTDAFFWFSGDVADEMGVPWVALWTAAPCSFSVHLHTDQIRSMLQGWDSPCCTFIRFIFKIYFIFAFVHFV